MLKIKTFFTLLYCRLFKKHPRYYYMIYDTKTKSVYNYSNVLYPTKSMAKTMAIQQCLIDNLNPNIFLVVIYDNMVPFNIVKYGKSSF